MLLKTSISAGMSDIIRFSTPVCLLLIPMLVQIDTSLSLKNRVIRTFHITG